VDRFLECKEAQAVDVCRVVVQEARDVSQAVASKTGVRHESPQVLLIRDGQCVWNTAHRNITMETLKDIVKPG
jgi:bacillithiol system protein YtxJ